MSQPRRGGPFRDGFHRSHGSDPIGTTSLSCPDCLALWDARMRQLVTMFHVVLAQEVPELDRITTSKVIAALFVAAKMTGD